MRKALLVAIKLKDNIYFEETLEELKNLCDSADIEIISSITQASNYLDPNTAVRSGKLDEIKNVCDELDVDLIVFGNNLSINVVSNLKEILDIEIMDRTNLILDIFSKRARSKEAQIQTEMARLKYDLPILLKDNMDSDKQRGGTDNNRGAGETRGDIIKRKIESRISQLRNELKDLENRKEREYLNRNSSSIKKVALVGYTNAGKSSLMNNLLKMNEKQDKSVYEKNQLFATLDTSVRNIKYKNYEFLLYDTVGFVSDLPHGLIEAFKSTLKAASYADLLIHVVDYSNPYYRLQEDTTFNTLKEIGADHIDMIEVYNKCDLIDKDQRNNTYLNISSKTNEGIDELLKQIIDRLYPNDIECELLIPYDKSKTISDYKKRADFKLVENNESGSIYLIKTSEELIQEIKKRL